MVKSRTVLRGTAPFRSIDRRHISTQTPTGKVLFMGPSPRIASTQQAALGRRLTALDTMDLCMKLFPLQVGAPGFGSQGDAQDARRRAVLQTEGRDQKRGWQVCAKLPVRLRMRLSTRRLQGPLDYRRLPVHRIFAYYGFQPFYIDSAVFVRYSATLEMLEGRAILKLDQDYLETVIPVRHRERTKTKLGNARDCCC